MHKMGIFTLVSICTTPSRIVSIWLDKAPPASKNFFPFRFANQHHTLYCRFNLTSSLGPQKVTMQCLGVLSKFCTGFHSLSVWYWNDPHFRKWCRTEHPIWQWLLLHMFTTMAYWSGSRTPKSTTTYLSFLVFLMSKYHSMSSFASWTWCLQHQLSILPCQWQELCFLSSLILLRSLLNKHIGDHQMLAEHVCFFFLIRAEHICNLKDTD